MEIIQIGTVLSGGAGTAEGVYFTAGESGYTFMYNHYGPSQQEIDTMTYGPVEIRWTTVGGVLTIAVKVGNFPWVDAPFAPQLCPVIDSLTLPSADNMGTPLTLLMTDARSGVVKGMRVIGLSHKFSASLLAEIQRINKEPFNKIDYMNRVLLVQNRYSSKEIAQMASDRYKLKDN